MTDVLASLVGERFRAVPAKCELRDLEIRTLCGVPHCGSAVESEYLPPGSVVCVNADAVLCEENSIICGAAKPPQVTAVFKMLGLSRELSQRTDLEMDVETKVEIHGRLLLEASKYCSLSPNDKQTLQCSPDFLSSINKHPWLDDDELLKVLKANLGLAQEAGPHSGIYQYAPRNNLRLNKGEETWPCVVIPGACSTVLQKDELSGCEVDKMKDFPGSSYSGGNARKEQHEHINRHNSLALESESYSKGGTMLFQSELGGDGCVGLYLKKIPSSKRLSFLQKYSKSEICGTQKVTRKTTCQYAFSTMKYKYYIIVRCAAGQTACDFYERMVRGVSFAELTSLDLSAPTTIGDFACSSYYRLYVKQCAENARRIAFKFAKCLQISVPLFNRNTIPTVARLKVCQEEYENPEVHWGLVGPDVRLHKVHKLATKKCNSKLNQIVDWILEKSDVPCQDGCQVLQNENDNSLVGCATCGGQKNRNGKKSPEKAYWKKHILALDASAGVPPMGKEKYLQYDNALRLVVSPSLQPKGDNQGLVGARHGSNDDDGGGGDGGKHQSQTYVQIHNNTLSLDIGGNSATTKHGKTLPNAASNQSAIMVRLPPLQGYSVMKLREPLLSEIRKLDCNRKVIGTSAMFTPESSFLPSLSASGDLIIPGCTPASNLARTNPIHCHALPTPAETMCKLSVFPVSFGQSRVCNDNDDVWGPEDEGQALSWHCHHSTEDLVHEHCFVKAHVAKGTIKRKQEWPGIHLTEKHAKLFNLKLQDEDCQSESSDCEDTDEDDYDESSSSSLYCKGPHRKTKAFETELLYDSNKNKMYISPLGNPRIEAVPHAKRCERQPIFSLVGHDFKHGLFFANAIRSVFTFPSDMRNDSMLMDLNGNALHHGVNPKHLSEPSRHHVLLEETLTEMVQRCMGAQGCISLTKRERNRLGEKIPSISLKYTAPDDHDDVDVADIKTYNPKVNLGFTFAQYRPVCCVESLPLPHYHVLQRNVVMARNVESK